MIRTFRYSFILAKIYGMLARTWVGANFRDLLRLRRVQDLYDRLFPGERAEKPEHQLTADLELRVAQAGVAAMTYVLDSLGDPPEILVHILRSFEYQGVKSLLRASVAGGSPEGTRAGGPAGARGGRAEPPAPDLGRYGTVDFSATGPGDALEGTPYAWAAALLATTPVARIENMLDQHYYRRLLELTRALPRRDRAGVSRLVGMEIALADAVWALRLRFAFGLDAEKARELLVPGLSDADRRAVELSFDIPADSIEGWRKWRFGWLVEDQLSESFKAPDPVRAEQKATRRLYARAHHLFHQDPFTLTPLVAFFKLKKYEVSFLNTAVEALRLSVSEQDVLALVGAQ
jgi:vacuolar-type H+-ATPase subunit C/Vma6